MSILCADTPSPPQQPDPAATGAAQTASNVATANANAKLNRINQTTPWGTQTYSEIPGTADAAGTSQWQQKTTLDPAQQKLLDTGNILSQSLADTGQKQLSAVSDQLAKPIDYSKFSTVTQDPLAKSINTSNIGQTVSNAGPADATVANAGPAAATADSISRTGVTPMVGGDALAKAMTDAQRASYENQSQYLDPSYKQKTSDLTNQLTQQGVMQNSDAWNRAVNNLDLQRRGDYTNAYNNSVGLGNAAEAQLYGQGLSSNQNAFGQNAADAGMKNQAAGINDSYALNNAQLANQAAGINNSYNLNNAQLANQAQSQLFNQNTSQAAQQNAAAGQSFNQSLTNQQWQDQLANQSVTQPLNTLNALRNGAQVAAPQFGATPGATIAGTNTAQIAQNAYNNQLGVYNSQVGSQNQMTGGLFGLGAAGIGAYGSMMAGSGASAAALAAGLSDRLAKDNIVRIGERPDGIGIYSFTYKPQFHGEYGDGMYIGVMADEVEKVMPEAVLTHSSGFKMVDYGRLQ